MLSLDLSVDFIMDGATEIKQSIERFPVTVYPDPVFLETDTLRVDDYMTVWPCTHDRITIKVLNVLFTSRLSGRGNRISPMFPSFHLSVFLSVCQFISSRGQTA